jgi:hypothetical protein
MSARDTTTLRELRRNWLAALVMLAVVLFGAACWHGVGALLH